MIRILGLLGLVALVSACTDPRGTQYSSKRAQSDAPVYVPVTPAAAPVAVNTVPAAPTVAVQPIGAAPAQTGQQPTPAVLTQPIALTPNTAAVAQPQTQPQTQPLVQPQGQPQQAVVTQAALVTSAPQTFPVAVITPEAPAQSLKPRAAPRSGQTARVIQASAPAAVATTRRTQRSAAPTTGRRYAKGSIYTACRQAGRKEASDRRCGCVQWVANRELTPAQQRRGAGYFNNQQGLQDARQSDNAANERFWKAWKAFGQTAGQTCRST